MSVPWSAGPIYIFGRRIQVEVPGNMRAGRAAPRLLVGVVISAALVATLLLFTQERLPENVEVVEALKPTEAVTGEPEASWNAADPEGSPLQGFGVTSS